MTTRPAWCLKGDGPCLVQPGPYAGCPAAAPHITQGGMHDQTPIPSLCAPSRVEMTVNDRAEQGGFPIWTPRGGRDP